MIWVERHMYGFCRPYMPNTLCSCQTDFSGEATIEHRKPRLALARLGSRLPAGRDLSHEAHTRCGEDWTNDDE